MQKVAKMLALVMGGLFLVIGGMSFLPMGLFGPGGLMVKYPNMPYVHLAFGVIQATGRPPEGDSLQWCEDRILEQGVGLREYSAGGFAFRELATTSREV